ncbi:enoyl-CoA hydratase/isomerase family protein [Bacillus andreraoultii]|uniref:enoyl-CoA hydratase/isomerase family protein n=1 Tax=Bacillus andreraoultii TaxID=1499685 RepID=UPI00053B4979|nr:enoyl-CoA hydratase-related protein [Bacillus andreraoultii]
MSNLQNEQIYMVVENQIATIYMNRPEKRNALSFEMWESLNEYVDQANRNREVKVIIFRSTTEEAFSAGADIREFETRRSTVDEMMTYSAVMGKLEEKVASGIKPTIAMIQGYCVGGGCELAVACDFRFSDPTGKFGITPAKLGIVYNTQATKHLVDLVGPSNAKDILYTGRIMGADEALHMGLINRIYHPEQLEDETYRFAKMICDNSQYSVRGTKKIVHHILHGGKEDNEEIMGLIIDSVTSEDYKEGVDAFLNKRKPNFPFV